MMPLIVPIVEGDGEIEAVPLLLRKLLIEQQCWTVDIALLKNAHGCGNLTTEGGLEKFVELAFRTPGCDGVLVLMDADEAEDCPATIAREFADRIAAYGARKPVSVVLARREYEAWFLASLGSIAGHPIRGRLGLPAQLVAPPDPEAIQGAKGWITRHLPNGRVYKETEDQAPMTHLLDTALTRQRSRSFRRFCAAVAELTSAITTGACTVTP
jgi:hypothetical protein